MNHVIIEDSGPAERLETERLIGEARQAKNHGVANHFILLGERLRFERSEVERLQAELDVWNKTALEIADTIARGDTQTSTAKAG